MNILHCSPLGTSVLGDFIHRLQEEGDRGGAGRTALLLPSPYLLEQARTRLRQCRLQAWEFPRVLSLDELAESLAGHQRISRVAQELLLEEILAEAEIKELCGCFSAIADFPGFVAALARLFDEFKLAAVTPEELEGVLEALAGEAERAQERDQAIAALFVRYQEKLTEHSLVDVAGTYMLAVEALEQATVELPFDRILMSEFSVLSPLRFQLIAALQKRVQVEIGICFEKDRSGIFAAVEPVVQTLLGLNFILEEKGRKEEAPKALAHIRRELFSDSPQQLREAAGVRILLSPTRRRKLEVVADAVKSWLLRTGRRPDEVALVLREPVVPLIGRVRSGKSLALVIVPPLSIRALTLATSNRALVSPACTV